MRTIIHQLNQNLLLIKTFIDLLEEGQLSELQESKDILQAYQYLNEAIDNITTPSSEALQRSYYDCTKSELRRAFGTITSNAAAIIFYGAVSTIKDETIKGKIVDYYHDVINAKVSVYKDSLK